MSSPILTFHNNLDVVLYRAVPASEATEKAA